MKTDGSARYYSSLPNEASTQKRKATRARSMTPTRRKDAPRTSSSPRKRIDGTSSSISNAVVTTVTSARKIKDKARSFVPRKFLSSTQFMYTPPASSSGRSKRGELDEITPVIYFTDEDAFVKKEDTMMFVDPFSFEDAEVLEDGPKKDAHGDSNSPTSVIPVRLFPQEAIGSNNNFTFTECTDKHPKGEDFFEEMVSFECPIFTQDVTFNEEDTSIDLSEAIKSINTRSMKDTKMFLESIRAKKKEEGESSSEVWESTKLPWDGFRKSPSFSLCEWDPTSDGTSSFENSKENQ